MTAGELLQGVELIDAPAPSTAVRSIAAHPSGVRGDTMFFKVPYPELRRVTASDAIKRGARYLVLEETDEEATTLPTGLPVAIVRNARRAYAVACGNFFGNVHRNLTMIGVTGTKGKTTTCHLIEGALRASGFRTGLVSTLVRRIPARETPATNTTPEPFALHHILYELHRDGGTHCVLEVSSIGIEEERVYGLNFAAAVFTNLGSDHFAYHGGRDRYIAAKRRLFEERSPSALCVINTDDPIGRSFAAAAGGRIVTYGMHTADVTPEGYSFDSSGLSIRIDGADIDLPLVGDHNVYNVLAAYAVAADVLGSKRAAAEALKHAQPLPGRMERVPTRLAVDVYVDYAHTPESVEAILKTVRALAGSRRCIALIGCSGNSDRSKRGPIARAAASGADRAFFTSDNPGHEHPAAIVRDMLVGVGPGAPHDRVRVVLDRGSAISAAIEDALPDGVVVLLGKGTETFQLVSGGRSVPHSDVAAASLTLRSLEARTAR